MSAAAQSRGDCRHINCTTGAQADGTFAGFFLPDDDHSFDTRDRLQHLVKTVRIAAFKAETERLIRFFP